MRTIILDPAGNLWGSERVLLDFLGSKATNKSTLALCCPPNSLLEIAAKKLGVTVYSTFKADLHQKGKFSRLLSALGLLYACRKFRADIIYVNQAGASRIALFVGRILGIPIVPHVRLIEDVKYVERLHANTREMPRVLAISGFIGDAFHENKIKQRVYVLYDPYASKVRYDVASVLPELIPSFCCAGRLVPIKGQDVLIRAVKELANRGIKVGLSIYGEGLPGESFHADLVRLVDDVKLNSEIHFDGFVTDVPTQMHHHRAVICPSHIEPLGRIIFEAWDSACLPIVGRFSGGAAEVVGSSGGGLLYYEQTPESLADTIEECLKLSPHERAEMINKGRRWLQDNCNPEEYSCKLLEVLQTGAIK